MGAITPFFMLDVACDEAARHYASIFKDSKIHDSSPMQASFRLNGQEFMAFRGGPSFEFGQALSLYISCKDQAEIDHYWNGLSSGGGEGLMCGWVRDKYGCSWQVVPETLGAMLSDAKKGNSQGAMAAMMKMHKLDIKALEKAYKTK